MQVLLKSKLETINIENIKKIVVIADTHIPVRAAKIPEKITNEFKNAELIVHAGDYQTIEVVNNLKKSGKFIGVCGNMDSDDVVEELPEKIMINIKNNVKNFRIGVMHGFGAPEGLVEKVLRSFEEKLDCIVFAHSHNPFNEKINNILLFNPGSACDTVFTTINTFGILELSNEIKGKIIKI